MDTFTTHHSDEHLIELMKNRRSQGISMLYDKYSSALFSAILRVVRAKEIAEEVLQDTFTKAWRHIDSYDVTKGRLYTWLLNIARNGAIDATRTKNFGRQNDPLDTVKSIDNQLITSFNTDTIGVKNLTEQLTHEHKILIDLIYFEGFTQAEAAEHLSMPIGTIKTRLRMAMTILKRIFLHTNH
jgi:RNA polymerase sigma-70 factor, ECF subfamily